MVGAFFYILTRRLKAKGALDGMYFMVPYMFANYSIFIERQHKLFELGYPAHPYIFQKRTKVVNSICYYYPGILKNEIEYLHAKIHGFKEDEVET